MALEDLIARIEQDADAQVEAIRRAADAEVAAIALATTQALSARTEHSLEAERLARRAAFGRQLADRRRAARARELAARHATVDRVFARALAILPPISRTGAWDAVWPRLASEALSYLPGAAGRVRCPPEIAAIIRPTPGHDPRVTVSEDTAVSPGLVVEAGDGSVTIDATLATCLAQRRPQLAIGLLPEEGRDA